MTLLRRRLLYSTYIIIFLISGSFILFYLQGYRLNHTNWQIERTGAIQVDSKPKNAIIKLNGQTLNNKTPATILSLRQGEYDLELSLPGYQSWHKKLLVSPAEVVFTGDVTLWPESNTGLALNTEKLNHSWLSPNGENLLYTTTPTAGTELWLLNLKSGQTRLLARQADSELINLEWSPLNKDILLQEKSGSSLVWRIYNLETNTWQEVTSPMGSNLNLVRWGDERIILYATTADALYELNLRTQANKLIWREKISDFRLHEGVVFALTRGAGEALALKLLTLSNLKTISLPENPIISTNVKFLPYNRNWLTLFDADRHTLYLLRSPSSDQNPVRQLSDITTVSWAGSDGMVITNNFEIWQYHFNEDAPSFIERLSTTLSGAQRYDNEPYIIFSSENELWVLELDNRHERQRWLLAKFDSPIIEFFLGPDIKTIYVQTTNDIYRLNLLPETRSFSPPTGLPSTMIQKYLHPSSSQ